MPDYALFTAEDYVLDPAFLDWVRSPTPERDQFWQAWLAQHPNRATAVEQARQFVLSIDVDQPVVSQEQVRQDVDKMLQRIGYEQPVQQPFQTISRSYWPWAAAAAIVLLLGAGWLWNRQLAIQPVMVGEYASAEAPVALPNGQKTQRNASNRPVQFVLPDGSLVTLAPKSEVTYPANFGLASRDVTLSGEAFFSVIRNEHLPFLVYTDDVVTKVLGTSFRVRAYRQDAKVTVAVSTGKVSVYARADAADVRNRVVDKRVISLTPNQQAEFSRERAAFIKTLVQQPVIVAKQLKASEFEFDETPVRDVFQRFKRAYGIDINYDANLLRDCALTASLGEETLAQKLDIVCRGIEATYDVVDGTIVIHSKGCR